MKLLTSGMTILTDAKNPNRQLAVIYLENATAQEPSKSYILSVTTDNNGSAVIGAEFDKIPQLLSFKRKIKHLLGGGWNEHEPCHISENIEFYKNQALFHRAFKGLLGKTNTADYFKQIGLPFLFNLNDKPQTPNFGDWA